MGKNTKNKFMVALIIILITGILAGVCFFVYRFAFGEKETAPAVTAQPLETAEPKTTEKPEPVEEPKIAETAAAGSEGKNDGLPAENVPENQEDKTKTGDEASTEADGAVTEYPPYVEDYEIVVYANGEEMTCRYTGALTSGGKLNGEGHYVFPGNDGGEWTFDGTCVRNNLWNGRATNQPYTFQRGDMTYNAVYTGDIERTVPEGQGTLIAKGTGNYDFTYSGGWKNGAYEGYGELDYDNPSIIRYHGNFAGGVYTPTFMQLITALCSTESNGLKLTDQVKEYLEKHEKDILEHNVSAADVSAFNYDSYVKDQNNPDGRCFKTSMIVAQKVAYDESTFGYPLTEILGYANSGRLIYYGYYFGYSDKIEEGKIITVTAYPTGYVVGSAAVNGLDSYRFVAYEVE